MLKSFGCGEINWTTMILLLPWSIISISIVGWCLLRVTGKFIFDKDPHNIESEHNTESGQSRSPQSNSSSNTSDSSTDPQIKTKIKLLCFTTLLIIFILSILSFISLITFIQCPSKRMNNILYVGSVLIQFILYPIPFILLYILFYKRLIDAFKDTLIEISNKQSKILTLFGNLQLFFYFSIMFVSGLLFVVFGSSHSILVNVFIPSIIASFFFGSYAIGFILLLRMFIKQMKLCWTLFYNNNTAKQEKLLKTTVRLFVCCVFAICSSVFFVLINCIVINIPNSEKYQFNTVYIIFNVLPMDHLINTLCLYFQWPFFQFEYYKCCKFCHECVENKIRHSVVEKE